MIALGLDRPSVLRRRFSVVWQTWIEPLPRLVRLLAGLRGLSAAEKTERWRLIIARIASYRLRVRDFFPRNGNGLSKAPSNVSPKAASQRERPTTSSGAPQCCRQGAKGLSHCGSQIPPSFVFRQCDADQGGALRAHHVRIWSKLISDLEVVTTHGTHGGPLRASCWSIWSALSIGPFCQTTKSSRFRFYFVTYAHTLSWRKAVCVSLENPKVGVSRWIFRAQTLPRHS